MLTQLANHNPDIQRLLGKGYSLSCENGYLIVHDIPYLDANKNLQWGAIVTILEKLDQNRVKPSDHQVYFCGSHPCQMDGTPIQNMGGGEVTIPLKTEGIVIQRQFSHKPKPNGQFRDYRDFEEKINTYAAVISGPAMQLYPDEANPYKFRHPESVNDSVFTYTDTMSTRAEISDLAEHFKEEVVAVIGLGGTGSYLLDLLVKTPVKRILGFDHDRYHVHNAYRSPGQLHEEEFDKKKTEVYQKRYEGFRSGVSIQAKKIGSDSEDYLEGVTFAFVCVDKGSSRAEIFELLIRMGIPFIDVGMGLNRRNGQIDGSIRTTYYSGKPGADAKVKQFAPLQDYEDDEYRKNIQIAELNALNAAFAVIKYKQLKGFYFEDPYYYHMHYTIRDYDLQGED